MALLRSLLFALIFYGWTVPCGAARLPDQPVRHQRDSRLGARLGPLPPLVRAPYSRHPHPGRGRAADGARSSSPVKHQSMYETLEIVLMLDQPAMVLKRELADIPLWGWVVRRYGVIPVDRAGGAAALRRMMRAGEAAIAEGRPIMIFPEGTRVPPGEQPPLQPGFAGLYRALKLPVVPVAVDSGRLAPRGSFVKRPGIVTFRFGEADPAGPRRATRSRRRSTRRSTRWRRCMMPELGIIEGFFGRPWSWARAAPRRCASSAPMAIVSISTRPRPIPCLRRRWQEPYPEAELAELAAFRELCRAAGVRFGIGLSPFELHLHPERGWQDRLAAKLAELAQLKPDDLAILFDDMRGDVPDLAERQAAIVHFAAERGIADRIFCCPSYYSDDPILDVAFGARPPFYLEQLGRLLDPAIRIFWTGRRSAPGIHARPSRPRRRADAAQADALGQLSGQ